MEILIVDDEQDIRNLIQEILEDEGYVARAVANSSEAYRIFSEKVPDLVILDIWLQESEDDGLQILKKLKAAHEYLPVIMISGHGTIETAVSAIKDGAYDFIEKPFKSDRLLLMVSRALETARLKKENAALRRFAQADSPVLLGHSPLVQAIQQLVERVAPMGSRVLITGEPGTGKDVVARMIHKESTRKDEVFLVLNCATLRPERLEMELFGSTQGGQGGSAHIGILEQVHHGTLLLDEVSDMPLETQGKIVRVLQEQRFQRIGDQTPIEVDVRIVATTNRNLEDLMKNGQFREDLFYRLNVVPIHMPPLRNRVQDIPELAQTFLQDFLKQTTYATKSFSSSAMTLLKQYRWPGNIRELKNVMEWVVIMYGAQSIDMFAPEHLPPEIMADPARKDLVTHGEPSFLKMDFLTLSLREAREAFEREYLLSQVARFDGNISKTAQFVGMERSALHRKLKMLNISPDKEELSETEIQDDRKRA